ncbi:hypothetical protein DCC62_21570 [candidate division KSB1 bacterium]|nr:MAG: hypothetical protein DCC62_21570 [candidate division KSB1 bacterium]
MLLFFKESIMVFPERELFPDYEWELDFRCERCGEKHDLVFDKATETMYCSACLRFLHSQQMGKGEAAEAMKKGDLVY